VVTQKPFVAPGRRRYFVETMAVAPRLDLSETEREDLFWEARRGLDSLGPSTDTVALDRLEAVADEAFLSRHIDFASKIYERLAEFSNRRTRILLKLADAAHLRGDAEAERELRESIYGRLDIER